MPPTLTANVAPLATETLPEDGIESGLRKLQCSGTYRRAARECVCSRKEECARPGLNDRKLALTRSLSPMTPLKLRFPVPSPVGARVTAVSPPECVIALAILWLLDQLCVIVDVVPAKIASCPSTEEEISGRRVKGDAAKQHWATDVLILNRAPDVPVFVVPAKVSSVVDELEGAVPPQLSPVPQLTSLPPPFHVKSESGALVGGLISMGGRRDRLALPVAELVPRRPAPGTEEDRPENGALEPEGRRGRPAVAGGELLEVSDADARPTRGARRCRSRRRRVRDGASNALHQLPPGIVEIDRLRIRAALLVPSCSRCPGDGAQSLLRLSSGIIRAVSAKTRPLSVVDLLFLLQAGPGLIWAAA